MPQRDRNEIVLFAFLLEELSIATVPCFIFWGYPRQGKPVGKSLAPNIGKDLDKDGAYAIGQSRRTQGRAGKAPGQRSKYGCHGTGSEQKLGP